MTSAGRSEEDDLAIRFAAGDESALREAFDRWSSLVFRLAMQTLGVRDDADDVTQAVFVSAWTGRHGFDESRGALGGWIVGIARNRIADALTARTRRLRLEAALMEGSMIAASRSESDPTLPAMVNEQLARLDAVPRRVVELAYFDRISHSEISEELGIPIGTVKSHLRRSLAKIRVEWEVDDDAR